MVLFIIRFSLNTGGLCRGYRSDYRDPREKHGEPTLGVILIGGDSETRAGQRVYHAKARVYSRPLEHESTPRAEAR
jgi:hypothetical protein